MPATVEARRKMGKSQQARADAIALLIDKHKDEYEQLLGDAREKQGLPRDPALQLRQQQAERLTAKLDQMQIQHEAAMAKLRQQLDSLTNGA